jgi:hypothetical protein
MVVNSKSLAAGIFLLFTVLVQAQTAGEIMAKVAENQARAESARAAFVYHQSVLVRMKRANGSLAREESREYTVTPAPDGVAREMVHFEGKYGANGKEFGFSQPGEKYKDSDIDADVAKSLADQFGNDDKSRDGVNVDLFPLTSAKQQGYIFTLAGTETYHDRKVFRITFEPRKSGSGKSSSSEEADHEPWAGEALIDQGDLTPALITTHLAKGVPLLVKTMLGTNVQQLGFKITYDKFDDNLWFPVNYSGELKLRVLFVYARTISLGLINSEFQKADVKTSITFEK